MKVVLATRNAGKVQEFQTLLKPAGLTIISQDELNIEDKPETGLTFIENAILKARHAAQASGLPAIADDSGLCVPALKGAPGIYSARYAGEKALASNNMDKLLHELQAVPQANRQAYFYCVLVFMKAANDPTPIIAEGKWDGIITESPRGENGFGYDPVFFVPAENKTAAELSIENKNTMSHRAKALAKLLQQLRLTETS